MAFAAVAYAMAQGARRKVAAQPAAPRQEKSRDNRPPRMPSQPIEALRQDNQNKAQVEQQQAPQMAAQPVEAPAMEQEVHESNNTIDENADVPSDWFVPKVFKSSKPQE
jgi:hypothetical protein